MLTLSVQIIRLADASFPSFVECALRDASDREWILQGKLPVFTNADLNENSSYPQPGVVACEIVREWIDDHGRRRCIITTERPWGITTRSGETEFEVFSEQITSKELNA